MPRRRAMPVREQQAWARVRIHLNLREVEAATWAAREASRMAEWGPRFGPGLQYGSGTVYGNSEIPSGWAWFEPESWRLMLNRLDFEQNTANRVLIPFSQLVERLAGSCFRTYDPASWRLLEAMDEAERPPEEL